MSSPFFEFIYLCKAALSTLTPLPLQVNTTLPEKSQIVWIPQISLLILSLDIKHLSNAATICVNLDSLDS